MGHNSRQQPFRTRDASILPARIDSCLTLIVSSSAEKHFRCQNNKKYIPILREVLLTHECPDVRMSFNNLMGQNRDNKQALHCTKLPSLLTAHSNASKLYCLKLRLCMSQHDFFPISLLFCTTGSRRVWVWLHGASSR